MSKLILKDLVFIRLGRLEFSIYNTYTAGKLTLAFFWDSDKVCIGIHLLPHKAFKSWGFLRGWNDGPLYSFGFGPFLLITW